MSRRHRRPLPALAWLLPLPVGHLVAAASTLLAVALVAVDVLAGGSAAAHVSWLLLVPAGLPAAALLPRRPGNPVAQMPWWRITGTGYTLGWTGAVLRTVGHVPDPLPSFIGSAFGAAGLLTVFVGMLLLQSERGADRMPDVVLDAGQLACAFGLAIWCFVLRPSFDESFHVGAVLDFVTCATAAILSALLGASVLSGPIRTAAAFWSALGMTCYAFSFVVVIARHEAVPVVAQALWAVCGAYTVVPLLDAHGADREPTRLPWSPRATALAYVIPLAAYCLEAVRSGGGAVPDALPIGATLMLLGSATILRVARLVTRSQVLGEQLNELANRDHLTQLANRRSADALLTRRMEREDDEQAALSVAMIDLDHFKAYNDTKGHHAGDRLLVDAAAVWTAMLGEDHLLARYGGEEFLLVADGMVSTRLAEVVDALRRATPYGQTFSAGIASWDGQECLQDLVARADGALYDAKEAGRARTCVAVPPDDLAGAEATARRPQHPPRTPEPDLTLPEHGDRAGAHRPSSVAVGSLDHDG